MDHRQLRQDEQLLIAERAAEWLVRLKDGATQDKRAFMRWLRRSPEHVGEVLLATSTDTVLRQFFRERKFDPASFSLQADVVELDQRATGAPLRHRASRPWLWAAGLSAAAALAAALIIQRPAVRDWLHQARYSTSIGEQRLVQLADGSSISINTQSSVHVRLSKTVRDVYLDRGQAIFTVAHDPSRLFRVHAGDNVIQALGTKFDVWRHSDRISVAVIEGAVQVSATGADGSAVATAIQSQRLVRVDAGQGLNISKTDEVTSPAPVNVADVSAWQQRRLVFSDSTLTDIAEEFSRYNRKPRLRIEGDALRARRLSGVFDANSPDALLTYLAIDHTIAFDRHGDDIVIRSRGASDAGHAER